MGSCCTKEEEASQIEDAADERKRLLENPVSGGDTKHYGTSDKKMSNIPNKSDDDTLCRIVKQVEVNVIDVPALKSMEESRDFMDKAEKYTQRLSSTVPSFTSNKKSCLLEDIPVPEEVLSKNPVSPVEKEMMNNVVDKTLNALKEIKIDHKEDLVVPFILT
ncbi:ragulator complex protein LAMTOR1-like [Centruroides vittatus]|uniref:ragulator complex protein LAMTOR1-like n=1 Tax=Centruroides vittatus TaxID=120091 RepID=UPI003510838F